MRDEKFKSLDVILLIIIFLFYLYNAVTAEMIGDDLIYLNLDLNSFKDAVCYCLHYGNGRFIGNLFGLYLSRVFIFKIIVKTLVPCLIIIFLNKLCNLKYKLSNFLLTAFFVLLPSAMFRDVISWTSGFANYMLPVLFFLINLIIIEITTENCKNYKYILIFTGFIGQLFVEHFTVLNILVAFLMLIYYKKRNESKKNCAFIWFVSSVIGAVCMFLIPKIFSSNATVNVGGYRTVNSEIAANEWELILWNVTNRLPVELKNLFAIYIMGIFFVIIYCLIKTKSKSKPDLRIRGAKTIIEVQI